MEKTWRKLWSDEVAARVAAAAGLVRLRLLARGGAPAGARRRDAGAAAAGARGRRTAPRDLQDTGEPAEVPDSVVTLRRSSSGVASTRPT